VEKFEHPDVTATGEERARVALSNPTTLWFNTGTLCNIECANCYIESSPTNDRLVYLTLADVVDYLDQLEARNWGVTEIGFTGGEPYMNPEMNAMTRACLERGYEVLVLTNAMRPMMRKAVKADLATLVAEFGDKLTLRVSVDHWSAELHDQERGQGSFEITMKGVRWLRDQGARLAFAGRTVWGENDERAHGGASERRRPCLCGGLHAFAL
jgi:MoaA/NifB/PqqE/SkfB family radical SAM enzyme